MRPQGSGWPLTPRLPLIAVALLSSAVLPCLHASNPRPQADPAGQQTASQPPASPAPDDAAPAGAPAGIPQTLPKGKKLVLTDGSFQMVREYQRQGDRVRYYSVERSDWEEIPASLVDWAATQKAEADVTARDQELTKKIKASELAARTADINSDRSLEVRPGVILPDDAGLYLLDGKKVYTLEQDLAVSRVDKARTAERVLTGVPLIPNKHHIELPGKTAKLRIHGDEPEFYFRPADGRDGHLSLLRLEVIDGKRDVETMTTNVADISTYKNHQISLLAWDAARGVKRFTVDEKLEPGEYAIVENRPDGVVDLYLWDFGVDANPDGADPAP